MSNEDSFRALFEEIREACRKDADPARAAKYERYFKEGYDAYGIDLLSEEWTARRKKWVDDNREQGIDGFLTLGARLVATGKYEEASLALLFIREFASDYSRTSFDRIAAWFETGIRNWGHTDVLCGEVLGDFLKRQIVPLAALKPWRESPHKYQRRAVPVMMIGLLKEATDYRPLLAVIRPMMHDRERVVQQGLGWFLREAWKRQPRVIETFLVGFKDTAPRLIFQYATEKMTPEAKARFRAVKVKKAGA